MTRVAFATLGCRVNQVDTQEIQGRLEAEGFRTVAFGEPADVVVINTCTVTARAECSDRQLIRRAVRNQPHARVVVTGCWAQTSPGAVAAIPGVDMVVGVSDRHRIGALIGRLAGSPETAPLFGDVTGGVSMAPAPLVSDATGGVSRARAPIVGDVTGGVSMAPAPLLRGTARSRAFLKIQDGCQHRCAFCIVPFARGPSRSREPGAILDQARRLVESGHPEIVLTGIDMGHFGGDLVPRTSLAALLHALSEIRGLHWIRLSSILPAYFTSALIEAVTRLPAIAPHLHVPLQSGSDRVLRRMRRPYTARLYAGLVERLGAAVPGLGLGTDLIAGFPGETDDDAEETEALVAALPFSYLHVFAYSDRRGTEAARLDGHLPPPVAAARSGRLRQLGHEKARAFRERLLGSRQDVVVLRTRERRTGRLSGLTGNYVDVLFDGADSLMGGLASVRITGIHRDGVVGELAA